MRIGSNPRMGDVFSRLNLRRIEFGLSLDFISNTISAESRHAVVVNSIPKSGTNLLMRVLYLSGCYRRAFRRTSEFCPEKCAAKKNVFYTAHLPFSDEILGSFMDKEFRNILIVRHPYDVIVSNIFYIKKDVSHRLFPYFRDVAGFEFEKMFRAIAYGVEPERMPDRRPNLSTREHFESYSGWLEQQDSLVIRFEDLVGEQGGSTKSRQRKAVLGIFEYLGVEVDIDRVCSELYSSDSRTFRSGSINSYSDYLDENLIHELNRNYEDVLDNYGYSE